MFFLYTTFTYSFPNVRFQQGTKPLSDRTGLFAAFSAIITTVSKRPKQELIVFSGTQ